MELTSIDRDILISSPIDIVWNIVTTAEQIPNWFGDAAGIDLRPGGDGLVTFNDYGTSPFRVVDVQPPTLFSFRWVYPEGEEPTTSNSTLVTFSLQTEGDQTRVRVVESGLSELDWDDDRKSSFATEHIEGWISILERLQTFVATPATTPVQ